MPSPANQRGKAPPTEFPRIYLAIDNCFASKRWTQPSEWAELAAELGLCYVEASADNECDPLYTTPQYLEGWIRDVKRAERQAGVSVVNLYSGHGTYTTLGLTHSDPDVRRHILDGWLKVMVRSAGALQAGLGFYCHAFPDAVLQSPELYRQAEEQLYEALTEIVRYGRECGTRTLSLEQMYTPHQIPWTLAGTERLLREVWARTHTPFYITIDTGHQTAQRRFLRPSRGRIEEALQERRRGREVADLWLGSNSAQAMFQEIAAGPSERQDARIRELEEEMDRYPHLFAEHEDGDPYIWLERFGCYSPIVHLQQTSGSSSSHVPFTRAHNETGLIHPRKVLDAIAAAYAREARASLPPKCSSIYLTLEIFSQTADKATEIKRRLAESVQYWRPYIPTDGARLDELVRGEAGPDSGELVV